MSGWDRLRFSCSRLGCSSRLSFTAQSPSQIARLSRVQPQSSVHLPIFCNDQEEANALVRFKLRFVSAMFSLKPLAIAPSSATIGKQSLLFGSRATTGTVAASIHTCHPQTENFSSNAFGVGSSSNHQAAASKGEDRPGMTNNNDPFDIAIVGGGMVGMALACALSSMPLTKSLRVAIIDNNPALGHRDYIKKNDVPDPRVSTVTPATISLFKGYFLNPRFHYQEGFEFSDNIRSGVTKVIERLAPNVIFAIEATREIAQFRGKIGRFGDLTAQTAVRIMNPDIGAWEYVQHYRHVFFDKMQVWDYTGLGYTHYNAGDVDREILGCVVENKVLQHSLLSCLQNSDLQPTIYPAKVSMVLRSQSLSAKDMLGSQTTYNERTLHGEKTHEHVIQQKQHGSLAKLDLSDGNSLYAKLVVGADGGRSRVREIAGFKTTGWNYLQQAIICTVEHATENHCAWQRFLPSGPIALLPIGDRFSNIVWTMSPEEASDRKSMNKDDFVKSVNHALIYGYGRHPHSSFLGFGGDGFHVPPEVNKVVTERLAFPLSLMHANEYASHRVVLIGDAAHTVHPLAGQGVNLGFGDAFSLSKAIAEGIQFGADIGELSVLKKYEKERKAANITMMAILDGFQKAFSVDVAPLNVLRAAAFNTVQYFGPLKRSIISFATGEQKWPLFF